MQERPPDVTPPRADTFAAAFGVGGDPNQIHSVDACGVTLAAVKGLHQLVLEQARELRAIESEIEETRRAIQAIAHARRAETGA